MIVRDFLIWMETAPAERRAEAAHALARAYLYADVDDETRSAMEAALTLLLDDPSADVRLALADSLGSSEGAPRHVIVSLAADQADVAELVLSRSPLFIDAELVDIAAVCRMPSRGVRSFPTPLPLRLRRWAIGMPASRFLATPAPASPASASGALRSGSPRMSRFAMHCSPARICRLMSISGSYAPSATSSAH
jgi:hypothetical protein